MTESYELRDLDGLGRQEHVDDQREHLLRKTSDEILQEEIRQLQGGLGGVEPYLPRKSTDSTGDRDDDMEEMINRITPSTDNPALESLTFRSVVLGVIFCILGAAASQVFYFKSNAPSFSVYFVILVSHPLGHLMARYLPHQRFMGVELNPGEFNVKEHLLVAVIASSGGTSAYASDIVAILRLYYHETIGALSSITLLITTQSIGFGLAGFCQNILVRPRAMHWPATLVLIQLFNTLHDESTSLTQTRLKIFTYTAIGCFLYQFLPGTFFPTLTSIATLCYINNQSWLMRTLGSGYEGLGMLNFSLDWSTIGYNGPLFTPWFAQLNWFAGIILSVWIVMPIMLAINFWDAREFPSPTSSHLYNATFQPFDVLTVLNKDLTLNETIWEDAKPLLLTPYFAISYALSFAALTAVLSHVWIWHRQEIFDAFAKRTRHNDIHNQLNLAYAPVPNSWYYAILAVTFAAAVVVVETSPLQTPTWMLALAIGVAAMFLIPIGIIAACSNTTIGLNVLTEFIAGIIMPGKPIGNVTFKCYGYMAMSQAIALLSDQKLAHYMHVSPKNMFIAQALGTVLGCVVNYVTLTQVIDSKFSYLNGDAIDPTGQWDGRKPQIFYSASVIWGAVAPARFFAGKYTWLYLGFPIGALLPFMAYWLHKRYPDKMFDRIVFPIIFDGGNTVPQAPANIILTSFCVAWSANVWLRKRYPRFYANFIYVISAALDSATSLQALTTYMLFSIVFPGSGPAVWWGNSAIDTEHCRPGS